MAARTRRFEKARGEIAVRLGGDKLELELTLLRPARELAAGAVKLAVAHQHPKSLRIGARHCGGEADQKVVSVGREHDRVWHAGTQLVGDMGLSLGPHFAHHPVPFLVGEPGRVFPRLDLAIEAGVGPQMMAVRGQVQPLRSRPERAREQMLEAQRPVLSAHNSGKARFDRVDSR